MSKLKVKRMIDDKPTELEIEESEILETDERITEKAPDQKPEKTLTQAEVNKLMAEERRRHKADLDKISGEFSEYRKSVEEKEKAANEAAEAKIAELKKDLPDPVIALLERLSPIDQLEWLSDPANVIPKKTIPELPRQREDAGKAPRAQTII